MATATKEKTGTTDLLAGFDLFEKVKGPVPQKNPVVALNGQTITINAPAAKMIGGDLQAVQFFYNPKTRQVAIRKANPEDPNAYTTPKAGRTDREGNPSPVNSVTLKNPNFYKRNNIEINGRREYTPKVLDERTLVIDLGQPEG